MKKDPNCLAKQAIARALVTLDCQDVNFFLEGIRYRQLEPVWGGTADTAVDLRCSCAMGLASSGYWRAIHELTALLNDSESRARQGAVRAVSTPARRAVLIRAAALHRTEPAFDWLIGIIETDARAHAPTSPSTRSPSTNAIRSS